MSSRAIRKALKQKEAATLVAQTKGNASDAEAVGSEDDNEDEDAKPRVNLFAMLNDNNEDEDDEAKLDDNDEEEAKAENPKTPSTPKKNKKKKRKGKGTGASSSVVASSGVDTPAKNGGGKKKETEDEIDRALRALNLKQAGKAGASSKSTPAGEEESDATLQRLLKIDSRNLDSTQEMKRLFGRTAISASDEDGGGLRQRRGQAGRRGVGIAGAVAGRGGTGRLLGMKRNIFVQPHDNWPLGNSGGLGMELVTEKDDTSEFTFVHSMGYQDVQRQFMSCVMSMDPQRMITLLQHNPYHISALLQVSEIAVSERDHTTAGELLERALFSLGRSSHSKFADAMARGRVRMDLRRFENREFCLAVWRYIKNLGMRGTWRTAEEFGRLLFCLDPISDPYQMVLLLDLLSLKAHQPQHLLDLSLSKVIGTRIGHLPNIAYSTALAYFQSEQPLVAREYLAKAITRFPWIVVKLFQELNIDGDLPPALWGTQPPAGDLLQQILCELYISRAKDLWNTSEAKKLLSEVATSIHNLPKRNTIPPSPASTDTIAGIPISLARHIILTDIPSVTALLPNAWKERFTKIFDPLPPLDEIKTYEMSPVVNLQQNAFGPHDGAAPQDPAEFNTVMEFLRYLLPWVTNDGPLPPPQNANATDPPAPPAPPAHGELHTPNWPALTAVLGPERTNRMRELIEGRAMLRQQNIDAGGVIEGNHGETQRPPRGPGGEGEEGMGIYREDVTEEFVDAIVECLVMGGDGEGSDQDEVSGGEWEGDGVGGVIDGGGMPDLV